MKKIDSFINRYSLSKTLQFKLVPYGKTLENFLSKGLLDQDNERSAEYKNVKKYIDRYHKAFIEEVLSSIKDLDISEYADLYYKANKSDAEKKRMDMLEASYRKNISIEFKSHPNHKKLFGKEIITEILPDFLTNASEAEIAAKFDKFTTYFVGFQDNRKNMYSDEDKSTGIAYRCINENLPKFLDNIKAFGKIREALKESELEELNNEFYGLIGMNLENYFCPECFYKVLTASGIERFNNVIGGYTNADGTKIQGINEKVNLFNQKCQKSERLPKMKLLYKQILSDRDSISFIPETFESDEHLLSSVNDYYNDFLKESMTNAIELFKDLDTYSTDGIYIKNGTAITDISNKITGSWSFIRDVWNSDYDTSKKIKNYEKHIEDRNKQWKCTESFSFAQLDQYISLCDELRYNSVSSYYSSEVESCISDIREAYLSAHDLLTKPYTAPKRLAKNDSAIELIKNLLDAVKKLERLLKPLLGSGAEDNRDIILYGALEECYSALHDLDKLYDMVRNHVTKKPYSKDKIKLNFENPQLLGGWDRNKEADYRTILLRKDNLYYLGVIDRSNSKLFEDYPTDTSNGWEKINYKLLPGPNKMLPKVLFAKSNIDYYSPSDEIMRIYKTETFKKGNKFDPDDCHKLIDFYKNSINKNEGWNEFGFEFKSSEQYADISEFYRDVEKQGYKITYNGVSEKFVEDKVNSGELYLFQIYSKDFSPYSKGTPNLHTLYFKMLFDERNLENVVYQLNGGAEMFYRFPSVKKEETAVHPKNQPIKNKNPNNPKKESIFEYDLIKDKRFTEPQFSLHIPIKLNFKSAGKERLNSDVRLALKNSDRNYVIGIDRGERNLLYITVVDDDGVIVEQFSANQVISGAEGQEYKVDYHHLLDRKEKERLEARQSWGTIENIKELKEGYVSQIVHKVCELAIKYDAVIAMEDLNSGFKNSRVKVEKQVYQKFEKMLIDKLNYYVNKKLAADENGGLLKAYQLTEKFESFKSMGLQNGFIFYVPAWLTSKIDPVTGFVDLLKPKYSSVQDALEFIDRFDDITFNSAEKHFEFSFDYKNFPKGSTDAKGKWTVCTYGDRIKTERSSDANGNYISKKIILTDEFISLFNKFGIDHTSADLKKQILRQDKKEFLAAFMKLLSLTLQMRNSITGTEEDYLISPVRNSDGVFYDSRNYDDTSVLPANADANGAYNIARKAHWAINVLKNTEDEQLMKAKLSISNKEWLHYVQK